MYLDANFFIHLHGDNGPKGEVARKILQRIVKGEKAQTSALTFDEVMWVLRRAEKSEEIRGILEETYATPHLEILDVTADIPLKALDIMEKYNLRPRDAFHLALMHKHNIKILVSEDADFERIPSIKRITLR